jgi:RNA polymerase sigma factor (sigma-70 family)
MGQDVSGMSDRNSAFWEKAYENNFKPLCTRARRSLTNGNWAEAEDVVSEAFLRVMYYVKNPETIGNLLGYLWLTSKRVWIGKRKKENTAYMDSLDDLLSDGLQPTVEPDAIRNLENKELEETIRAKQGALTPREKHLLKLYLEGYSCDEIGSLLDEDVRVVRSDLNAVKAKVRYRLKKSKAKTKGSGQP